MHIALVFVCAVIAMVLGFIWYGPLFGKLWARVVGMDLSTMTPESKKEMQKKMAPVYLLNFILVVVTAFVFDIFMGAAHITSPMVGVKLAFWIWLGFVMPTIAGQAMWSNKPKNLAWAMFLTSAGYQLVLFIIFGIILSY